MAKLRPMGDILLDMEKLLEEMVDKHELQKGDILYLVAAWVDVHRPDCIEQYSKGGSPVLYYGKRKK